MSTHEVYCSLDICKLLKEAGFDWKVNARWFSFNGFKSKDAEHMRDLLPMDDFELVTDVPYENQNEGNTSYLYSAPTLDVAQRWLREVKGMYIYVKPCDIYNEQIESWSSHLFYKGNDIIVRGGAFGSYEEALEAGIKKALEIIIKKGE